MRILLVNDDGVYAAGINALASALKKEHEVIVAAPKSERSGFSHSLTYYKPFAVEKAVMVGNEDVEAYAVDASPADCTKFAIAHLLRERKPDLIISGINLGMNVGIDTCYSGTVGAAMEAAMFGYKAMAVSCWYDHITMPDFDYAAEYTLGFIEGFDFGTLPEGTLININFPGEGSVNKGVKLTTLGMLNYNERYEQVGTDENGAPLYHLRGNLDPSVEEQSDIWALQHGYISVSPLKFDRVDHEFMEKLGYLEK